MLTVRTVTTTITSTIASPPMWGRMACGHTRYQTLFRYPTKYHSINPHSLRNVNSGSLSVAKGQWPDKCCTHGYSQGRNCDCPKTTVITWQLLVIMWWTWVIICQYSDLIPVKSWCCHCNGRATIQGYKCTRKEDGNISYFGRLPNCQAM